MDEGNLGAWGSACTMPDDSGHFSFNYRHPLDGANLPGIVCFNMKPGAEEHKTMGFCSHSAGPYIRVSYVMEGAA